MYGVDRRKKDAQCYYDSIFQLYADWGVDYVKCDDICNTNIYPNNPYSAKDEIEMLHEAIMKTRLRSHPCQGFFRGCVPRFAGYRA